MSTQRRASDQTIYGHDVYLLMQSLNGQQWGETLRELEQVEPALASYIIHAGKTVEMNLTAYGCAAEGIRTTQQFALHALVVVALAVRDGQRRLMDEFLPDDGTSGSDTEAQS